MMLALRKPTKAAPAAAPNGKVTRLKRQLARDAAVAGVVLLVLGAGTYFLSDWADGRTQARERLNGEVSKLGGDIGTLKSKLTSVEQSLPEYRRIFGDTNRPEIALERREAATFMDQLQETYFSTLRISMTALKDVEDARLKNAVMTAQSVEIVLSMESLSDEHIFSFLTQLRRDLPGKIKLTELKISRGSPLNADALSQISATGRSNLVRAEAKMVWLGMKPIAPSGGG